MANIDSDIQLLFGVLGGASPSGQSGVLIKGQLDKLMGELNKNPFKVRVGIDTDTGGKKSWSGQLQEKLDQISQSGKFSVQISSLKLSEGAVSDFRKQLSAIVNTIGLSTGTEITISSNGISEIKNDLQNAGATATDAARKIAEFKVQMEALSGQKSSVKRAIDSLAKSSASDDERARISELTSQYEQWAIKIEEVRVSKSAATGEYRAQIEAEGAAIRANIESINQERAATESAAKAEAEAANVRQKAGQAAEDAAKAEAAAQKQKDSALKAGLTLLTQMEKAERDWRAAQSGSSKGNYAGIQSDITELKKYISQLDSSTGDVEKFRKELARLQKSFSENANAIKSAGENTNTFSERMGGLAQKFSAWFSVSQAVMLGVRSIRQMVSATIELDDAMTQLRIVTRSTEDAYNSYMDSISKTATRIGSSITDLISSTTTYARLGYSLDESSALAEFTAMLQNVGDIDVADAQDALTAIVKAFGISVDEIESVMDKLVITGNNFPISVSQIAEGMNNASSALAAAGNTFDQSVALLTAANTTIQNAAKSSTGLRTIAARLRSTKTELDELGETMTETEYGNLVAALTKYNVALTDVNGEFRSTYDIVADIAAKWKDLSSMEQAALANAIAGVRQQSVFYSLVEQFQEASGAMEDMANSAGTLQASYATYMDSVSAHINQFKAAFQGLSQTTISGDFLNGIIDFGTRLVGILGVVAKLINLLGGLGTVLSTISGILITMNAAGIYNELKKIIDPIKSIITNINAARAAGATFGGAITGEFAKATASAGTLQLAIGGIGIALAVLPLAISIVSRVFDALTVTAEEATEAMDKSFSEFEEATSKVENLNSELETTKARICELEAKGAPTFVEQSELEKLRETNKLLQIQADLAEKERVREAKEAANDTVTAYRKNFSHEITADAVQDNIRYSNSTKNNAILASDESDISAMLAYIEQMKKLRDEVDATSEDYLHYQGLIDDTTDSIWAQVTVLQGYADKLEAIPYDNLAESQKTALNEINDAISLIYNTLDPAKWRDIQFNGLTDSVKDELNRMSAKGEMMADQVERLSERFPELDTAMERVGMTAGDVADYFNGLAVAQDAGGTSAEVYTAKLSNLSETISGMKSAYELLETAQEEMNATGGLSADTIAKLASSCDNYMDFLYEENGLIKLNTEAWEENADAKIRSDMDAIQREINSLENQNALLEQEKNGLSDRSGNTGVQRKISEINDEIRANNTVIEENQRLYSKYEGIYKSVSNAASGWVSTLAAFDGASSDLEQLASAQAELADGYTVTAAKAREFASVYPEILNEASVSADGQITLNEAIVNSFLKGKEAEIKGVAQAEAEKLRAKQTLLQAELAVVEEQIAAAESGDDAIVKSANESAQARMTLEQAVLSACEQAGIDEATANQLALAAMTGDWDTFQSLAIQAVNGLDHDSAIAFNSVMTNFAVTSQNMVDNTNQVIGAFNQMGKALQNAMSGVETELYSGFTSAGNISGAGNEAVKGLLSEMFEEGKSGYVDSEGGTYDGAVDQWKQRLQTIIDSYADTEPDLSGLYEQRDSLNKQIADIQNQIGLLDSLGNTSLDKFSSGTGKSGGSSGGSQKASDAADTIIDKVGAAEDNVNLLSKALGELRDSGRASIDTVSSLDKAMGTLPGFNKAVTALTRDGATMEEAQLACNELAEEMLSTSGILDMVTEENAEMIAGMLESIGVVNAHELVWRKLGSSALKARVAQAGLADAAWEDVEAYLASTDATQSEIDTLQALRAEQYNAALAAVDFTKANAGVTDELIRQAKAAGAGADKIEALMKIQKLQAMGKAQAEAKGYLEGAASFEEALAILAERARIEIGDIKVDVPDVNVNVEISGGQKESTEGSAFAFGDDDPAEHLSTTVKAWEAAVYRFTEATEKLRQATEDITDAERDIEMTSDARDKLAKQLYLIDKNRQAQDATSELIRQQNEEIQKEVEALKNEGISVEYDPETFALNFPGYNNEETLDRVIENTDREAVALEKLLNSPNFTAPSLGIAETDSALSILSNVFRTASPLIEKLNGLLGSNYTIDSFVEKQRPNGAVTSDVDNSLFYALEKKLADVNSEEREQVRREINGLAGEIDSLFRNQHSLASGVGIDVLGILHTLRDPNLVFANFNPTGSGGWDDKGDVDFKGYAAAEEAYEQTQKNIVEDSISLAGKLQENSKNLKDYEKTIYDLKMSILDTIAEVVEQSGQGLDTIQDVYSTLKQGAKEFSEYDGYLTLDTYQKILDLGPQYMQYLIDENGQWVINEERIQAVTAAKAEQLALDNAWAYVERLKLALQEDSIEDLNGLLYATTEAADGTWDLVYANLAMLKLDGGQYEAALHNIQVMRDLAYSAIDGIGVLFGATADSVSGMRNDLNDILNYVMEMLKQRVQDQVDALSDMKDAYGELIDAKKKSLDATKTEESYEKKRAKQLKEIAKLQARIDMLTLDDSREAQAERAKLLEQMAELQEGLSDTQSDYAIDNQKDALDKMKDAYDDEKDEEIKKLEDSISSQQKIYEMAIDYIQSYWGDRWDELKAELLQWNYDVGSDLEENLVSAWENATAAAQKYGDFVSAMDTLKNTGDGSVDIGNAVANKGNHTDRVNEANNYIAAKVGEMKRNSAKWWEIKNSSRPNKDVELKKWEQEDRNSIIANELSRKYADLLGGSLWRGSDGVWYLPDGRKLYDTSMFIYHKGGVVGDTGTLRDDEVLTKLQTGETVLTRKMWENAVAMISQMTKMAEAMSGIGTRNDWLSGLILRDMDAIRPNTVTNITNDTRPVEINIGDTIINGTAPDTVEKHMEISREMMNEIARQIRRP